MIAEALQNPVVLGAVIASLIGPAAMLLLGWARDQRKSQAQATRDVAEARSADVAGEVGVAGVVLQWSKDLREELRAVKGEVEGLKAQIEKLERQNRALRRHNEILTAQVVDLGGVPHAMPED